MTNALPFDSYNYRSKRGFAYLYFNAELLHAIKELKENGLTREEIDEYIKNELPDEHLLLMTEFKD